MKSSVAKHSVVLAGHKTSISSTEGYPQQPPDNAEGSYQQHRY